MPGLTEKEYHKQPKISDEVKAMMPKYPVFSSVPVGIFGCNILAISRSSFDSWYDREILPLFENAKVVPYVVPDQAQKYTALLINIQPIDQAVTKDEVIQFIRENSAPNAIMRELADRIEKFGVK